MKWFKKKKVDTTGKTLAEILISRIDDPKVKVSCSYIGDILEDYFWLSNVRTLCVPFIPTEEEYVAIKEAVARRIIENI